MKTVLIKLAVSLLLLSVLPGCWDKLEPENIGFVVAIAIDKGPQNDYLFTIGIAVPRRITGGGQSGSPGGGGAQNETLVYHTVEAPDIVSALNASQSFVARRISLVHAKAIIVGEKVAREGILPVLGAATRYREFRRTMFLLVAEGEAEPYLLHVKPKIESDPMLWFELELNKHNVAGLLPNQIRIHEFLVSLESAGTGAVANWTAYRKDIAAGRSNLTAKEQNGASGIAPGTGDQKAGDIRRKHEVPNEFMGTAVFKGQRMVGVLNGEETRLLNVLRGDLTETNWGFVDPSDESKRITVKVTQTSNPQIQVKRQNDAVRVKFDVSLEGRIESIPSRADYTQNELRVQLERSIEEQLKEAMRKLLHQTLTEWGADCFRIGDRLRGTFPTWPQWKQFQWGNQVEHTSYEVDAHMLIRRSGTQGEPANEGDQSK